MRKSLVLILALLASACERDQLHSNHPLLTAPAASFRDGVWLYADSDCPVDLRISPRQWPDCAHWSLVRVGWESEQNGALEGTPRHWVPLVVGEGDPGLLQSGRDGEYEYELIQPVAADAEGRLIEVRRWPVLCSDHVFGPGKKAENSGPTEAEREPTPPSDEPEPPASDSDEHGPPPPELPGAYRIGDRCFTDTPISLTTAQLRATRDDRFPGNFRWVRETVR